MIMEIKIKRGELCNLYLSLRALDNVDYSKIFLFYVHRNINLLEDEFNDVFALEQTTQPSGEFLEFYNKRLSLVDKYISKDENNIALVDSVGNYIIKKEKLPLFNSDFDSLKKEYATSIMENDSHINDVSNILDQVITINIEPIPFRYIPDDIKEHHWEYYKLLIKETPEILTTKYK
jgi:hypothetical protein